MCFTFYPVAHLDRFNQPLKFSVSRFYIADGLPLRQRRLCKKYVLQGFMVLCVALFPHPYGAVHKLRYAPRGRGVG